VGLLSCEEPIPGVAVVTEIEATEVREAGAEPEEEGVVRRRRNQKSAVDCVTNPLRQMTRYETCCSRFGPGGKHLNETKVWTAHLAVRPDLKVSDRKVLEKRVGLY
jgi:hypothetical protein